MELQTNIKSNTAPIYFLFKTRNSIVYDFLLYKYFKWQIIQFIKYLRFNFRLPLRIILSILPYKNPLHKIFTPKSEQKTRQNSVQTLGRLLKVNLCNIKANCKVSKLFGLVFGPRITGLTDDVDWVCVCITWVQSVWFEAVVEPPVLLPAGAQTPSAEVRHS